MLANCIKCIWWAGRNKATACPKQRRNAILIEANQANQSCRKRVVNRLNNLSKHRRVSYGLSPDASRCAMKIRSYPVSCDCCWRNTSRIERRSRLRATASFKFRLLAIIAMRGWSSWFGAYLNTPISQRIFFWNWKTWSKSRFWRSLRSDENL